MTLENQIQEFLEGNHLNLSVEKEKLVLQEDSKETGFFGIIRSDSRVCFGTCTDKYEVFQNSEMAELAFRLQEKTDYKIGMAPAYGVGNRVSIDLDGKDQILEYSKTGDVIKKSVRLVNSHDGSGSLRMALGSLVLSCTNGMTTWVKEKSANIRHTTNMRDLVEQALISFQLIKEQERTMMEKINEMIGLTATPDNVADVIQLITEVDPTKVKQHGNGSYSSDEYSTRRLNQAQTLMDSIREEMAYKGNNVWGLLNGVTHYTTHKAGSEKTRDTSKVFGNLMSLDRKAYDFSLELVN